MSGRRIDFLTAARYQRGLRDKVICSESWVESIVKPSADGQTWLYLPDDYPPGGGETLMRDCPTCRRICPPAGADGSPCCDCQTEKEQRGFLKWALHRQRRELLPELRRRWWGSAICYADFMDRPTAGLLGGLCLEQYGEPTTEATEGNALYFDDLVDSPTASDERSQSNAVTDPRLSLEIARRRLNPPKKELGVRASGCQIVLLPEDEHVLLKEIAYLGRTGRIMPSACRYTRHNPYLIAPEDFTYRDETPAQAAAIDTYEASDWECPPSVGGR